VKTRGLCELTLETPDPARLAGFYRRVLDLRPLAEEDDRIWLACGEHARLGLWSPGTKEFGDRGGRHVHFAFSVGHGALHEVASRLSEWGIEYRGPVEHEGGDSSLYFQDPEGNVVEAWDYFEDGEGADAGVHGLSG
jgi:catechol-2,3-dioxygenase